MSILKELADKLEGCRYRDEFSDEMYEYLEENNLVVLHGYSDDLPYISGALCEEFSSSDVYFDESGWIVPCEDECTYYLRVAESANKVTWNFGNNGWEIELGFDCEYETFNILDDGEQYCKAVVLRLADLLGVRS